MKPKTFVIIACTVLVLIIMMQNTMAVTVRVLFWQIVLPQILLIFLAALAGLLIGYLLGTLKKSRRGD